MSDLPSTIGPYEMLRVVATGGMGTVWHGTHAEDGHHAALKMAPSRRKAHVEALRREIAGLRGLRHPGLAELLGEGEHEGDPWYAMRWVPGETLSQRWSAHRVASSTSSGADATFAFDDAPLVTDEHEVQLLPEAVWRERLRPLVKLASTLAWLHGEGLVHCDVKPSNVVFSARDEPVLVDFGVLGRTGGSAGRELGASGLSRGGTPAYMAPEQQLGELVDARADFYALGALVFEGLTGAPPLAGKRVPRLEGVPSAVIALLEGLLAEERGARTTQPAEVARTLGELLGEDPAWEGAPSTRPTLFRPAWVGDEPRLGRIAARLADGHAVIVGRRGVGRSRAALEVARGLHRRELVALTASDPASWTGVFGEELPTEAPSRAALAYRFLRERGGPVVLWMDDLELGDDASQLLAQLVTAEDGPVRLLAAWCDDDAPLPPHLELFAVPLEPLSTVHLGSMLADLLGAALGELGQVGRMLSARAEGLPQLLVEDVASAIDEGWLVRNDGRWQLHGKALSGVESGDLPPPRGLRGHVERRVRALPADARDALGLIATLGRAMPAADIAREAGPVERWLPVLQRARLATRDAAGVRLSHGQIAKVVLEGLGDDARRSLHRRAAQVWLAREARDPAEVARHLDGQGLAAQAAPWHREAALAHGQAGAASVVIEHWERWLAHAGDAATAADLVAAASAARRLLRPEQSARLARRALACSPTVDERVEAGLLLADAARREDPEAGVAVMRELLEQPLPAHLVLLVRSSLAYDLAHLDPPEARRLAMQARNALEAQADLPARVLSSTWANIGAVAYYDGRLDDAATAWARGAEHAERPLARVRLSLNASAVEMELGQALVARPRLRAIIPEIERLGALGMLGTAELNLGLIEHVLGHAEVAHSMLARAVRRSQRIDDPETAVIALLSLGVVERDLYRLDAMERSIARVRELGPVVGDRRWRVGLALLESMSLRAAERHGEVLTHVGVWAARAAEDDQHSFAARLTVEGLLSALASGVATAELEAQLARALSHLTDAEKVGHTYLADALRQATHALAAQRRGEPLSPWGWAWEDVPMSWPREGQA
ncbi:MAG: hypothetical protein EP330_08320 [Deltaproteobacteria bacterium]|nr:MAG: hypothetical protein EP330_08320 [Deltaproteobacteria bacterium]